MTRLLPLLLLCPLLAHAQTTCPAVSNSTPIPLDEARLTWTASTWNGTMPSGAVVLYTVYRGATAVCTTSAIATSLAAQPVGLQTYTVTAKSAQSVPPNVESGKSNAATKTIQAPSSVNPPTNLLIAADLTAYKQRDTVDGFTLVAIGTIAPGTMCNPALTVNGYNVVPRAAVTLYSKFDTLPLKAFARCS